MKQSDQKGEDESMRGLRYYKRVFRMRKKNCYNCANKTWKTCDIHGYFWLDYVAKVTVCKDWKEKMKQ